MGAIRSLNSSSAFGPPRLARCNYQKQTCCVGGCGGSRADIPPEINFSEISRECGSRRLRGHGLDSGRGEIGGGTIEN